MFHKESPTEIPRHAKIKLSKNVPYQAHMKDAVKWRLWQTSPMPFDENLSREWQADSRREYLCVENPPSALRTGMSTSTRGITPTLGWNAAVLQPMQMHLHTQTQTDGKQII